VASGNLLGCLLPLRQGLSAKTRAALDVATLRAGLLDDLGLAAEAFGALEAPGDDPSGIFQGIEDRLAALGRLLGEDPADLLELDGWLDRLGREAAERARHVETLAGALGEEPEELRGWVERLVNQVRDRRAELAGLAPWVRRCGEGDDFRELGRFLPAEAAERWHKVAGVV